MTGPVVRVRIGTLAVHGADPGDPARLRGEVSRALAAALGRGPQPAPATVPRIDAGTLHVRPGAPGFAQDLAASVAPAIARGGKR